MTNQIDTLKREAKKLSRATSITHMQALDVLAVQRGYGHWGAFADHLARLPDVQARAANEHKAAGPKASGTAPRELLEHVLGMPLPHLEGCRHILVSGATSTGKTTLLNGVAAAIPSESRISAVEDGYELILPDGSNIVTIPAIDAGGTGQDAVDRALSTRPDMLFVGEVTTPLAMPVLRTMAMPDGPTVATTIHASDARDAAVAFAQRVAHTERGRLPGRVAVVHMERTAGGAMHVVEVLRSR